jgi:hypothetical protein
MHFTKSALFLFCFAMLTQLGWSVQKQYSTAQLVDVQRKTRDKVDMYLVNTPVTTPVPYFEIMVRLGNTDYVAEFTPRHEDEELPSDWVPGATVNVRLEKHYLFLKRFDGTEIKWIVTKRTRVKDQ